MRLTSTGLGIGTSSPAAKLQTQQTSNGGIVTGMLIQNVGSAANTAVSLDFAPHENSSSPTTLARINAIRTAVNNAPTDLVFSTFNASLQERMRIDASGNLGIGTSSPAYKLQVTTSAAEVMRLQGTSGGGSNNTQLRFYGSASAADLWAIGTEVSTGTTGRAFDFYDLVANANRMRIDASGNLGIGTSSPAYKLDVNGNAHIGTGDSRLIIGDVASANTESVIWLRTGSGKYAYSIAAQSLADESLTIARSTTQGGTTFTTASLTLNSSGNLGLGVTPSAWNGIYKAAEIGTAAIFGSSSYNSAAFTTNVFYNSSNSPRYIASDFSNMYWQDDGSHVWYNAPSGTAGNAITFTQAMTLDASGNLALGTTASLSSAANRVDLTINGSSTSMLTFGVNGTRRAYLISNGTDLTLSNTVSGATIFSTNDTERMRITSGGNVGIGVSSPNTQLQINGTPSNDWGNLTLFDTRSQAADRGGMISFGGYKSTTSTEALFAQIKGNKENGTSGNEAGYLAFFTNNNTTYAERMRITSSGEILVNTTTDAGAYYLQVNGDVYATAYYESSDRRLKDILLVREGSYGINTVTFKWKDQRDSLTHVGYLAQDVEKVLPDAVKTNPNGYKTVNYDEVQSFKIAALEQEVAELKEIIKKLIK